VIALLDTSKTIWFYEQDQRWVKVGQSQEGNIRCWWDYLFRLGDRRHFSANSAYNSVSTTLCRVLLQRFRADASMATWQQVVWNLHKKLQGGKRNLLERQESHTISAVVNNLLLSFLSDEHSCGSDNSVYSWNCRNCACYYSADFQEITCAIKRERICRSARVHGIQKIFKGLSACRSNVQLLVDVVQPQACSFSSHLE